MKGADRKKNESCTHVKLSPVSAMMLKAYRRFQSVSLPQSGVSSEIFRDCENKQTILNNQGFLHGCASRNPDSEGAGVAFHMFWFKEKQK